MKNRITYLILILLLYNCGSLSDEDYNKLVDQKTKTEINQAKIKKELERLSKLDIPENVLKYHIECLREKKKGEVLKNELHGDTLDLIVNFWSNCSLEGKNAHIYRAEQHSDTLFTSFTNNDNYEVIEIDEAGNTIVASSVTDCDCLFQAKIEAKNFKKVPKVIYVNGLKPELSHEKHVSGIK